MGTEGDADVGHPQGLLCTALASAGRVQARPSLQVKGCRYGTHRHLVWDVG